MTLATRRLIDASATLPAADRALLSLWTQRGLDDAAMAQMTGVNPATIAQRRDRIVADLSTELGLPPQDVATALSSIARSAAESIALQAEPVAALPAVERGAGNGGAGKVDPADLADLADPVIVAASMASNPVEDAAIPQEPQAKIEPERRHPEARAEPELASSQPSRQRGPLLRPAAALLSIAVVAVVAVVVTASSGGGPGRPASAISAASATSAASVTGAASLTSAPSATVPTAPPAGQRTLGPLPGGVAGVTGTVALAPGPAGTQRLLVHVSGLPSASTFHYEVWLYNSIIDSVPLGRLGPNGASSFTLPAVVARFASIDISRQPPGTTEPSGASLLRATNPLAGAPH